MALSTLQNHAGTMGSTAEGFDHVYSARNTLTHVAPSLRSNQESSWLAPETELPVLHQWTHHACQASIIPDRVHPWLTHGIFSHDSHHNTF